MDTHLVSVIVPTYNRPKLLERALNSLNDQTFKDFEVIIVNDGKSDVLQIISRFKKLNIHVVDTGGNKGLSFARNTGLQKATGKFIAYLDDDDIFREMHLQELSNKLLTTRGQVVYANCQVMKYNQKDGKLVYVKKGHLFRNKYDKKLMFVDNLTPVIAAMHTKACFDKARPFDETLKTHEDWDVWMSLAEKYEFHHVDKITSEVTFIHHGDSITNSKVMDFEYSRALLYKKYSSVVDEQTKTLQFERTNQMYIKMLPFIKSFFEKENMQIKESSTFENVLDNIINFFEALKQNKQQDLILSLMARTIIAEQRVHKLEKPLIRINLPEKLKF